MLSAGEEVCVDELEIKWVSQTRRSLCLLRSDAEEPIKCWENSHEGKVYMEISVSRNVEFQLKELGEQHLLVSQAFQVVHDNTQYRRRRRNAWSFF